jgi:lysophospholipase L1-like esterase
MSPGKGRPASEILADLAAQYGDAGRRLVRALRRMLGRSELVWDTWERLRNLQRMLGYARDAKHVPAGTVVFLGSSSVVRFPLAELFPAAPALNRGLGAESVADTMRRLRRTLPAARPAGVVVWAGANDLRALAADPLVIVERVARLLDAVHARFPAVPLALLGVPPWCDQTDTDLDRLRRLNDGLGSLAFARGVPFVDMSRPPLTIADGCLAPEMADSDRKHLGPAGYEQLARWILEEGGEAVAPLVAAAGLAGRAEAPADDSGEPDRP